MARITKKYMLADYPRLERKAGLLELYMHDTQTGREPDTVQTRGEFRATLYRSTSAMGGYVVWLNGGNTHIEYLDDAEQRACGANDLADRRIIVGELKIVRYNLTKPAEQPIRIVNGVRA